MAGVATDGRARGEGAAVAGGAAVVDTLSAPSIPPEEHLVALVDTPEKALKVVEDEVARRKLFTERKESGFLPEHKDGDGSTVVASNVWNPEQLKNLNLSGKDVTNTFVVDKGEKKLLGDFIRELGDAEVVKKCLQGLVYNADTKFYNEDKKEENKALLDFLNKDDISSEYTGNGNELGQVASLVEPPLKRFTDLLVPSAPVEILDVPAGAGAVDVCGPSDRVIGDPVSANDAATVDADTASVGQGGSNTGEKAASKPQDNVEDPDSKDFFRRELSDLLSGRAQFIRREVSPSEEADSSNGNREIEEDDHVELVKVWLRKQFSSEPFGAIREVVSADAAAGTTEGDGGSGESLKADTSATNNSSDTNSAVNFGAIVSQNSSAQEILANLQKGMIEIGIQSNVLAGKCFSVEQLSDGQCVIYPVLYSLREGSIDNGSLDNFYEVQLGQEGNCYGITDLAKIEIDQGGQISVTEKGQLFLPPNHPYFKNKTASPS